MLVVGAARAFALCHQPRECDSSVLKMEVCRARFVAGEKAGALFRGSNGRESLGSVAAGHGAQLFSARAGKGGEEREPKEPAAP